VTFADAALARRLETADARELPEAVPDSPVRRSSKWLGGCAIFVGIDSPLTQAIGIGMNGPVRAAELAELESVFFSRSRRQKCPWKLCPLGRPRSHGIPRRARISDDAVQ